MWFDFFLTRPYDRFAISHRPDLETTIAIFVVGVLVTELAARSRRHWQAANSSTAYVDDDPRRRGTRRRFGARVGDGRADEPTH